ncbi:MAG: MBL fold metallo-hydrolase [Bacillota bacterium]|nr:MBL fold metallo-hydrolase [Bacillota bacterium]
MKLIILGSYGPYPPAGGACSGYLLEHMGFYVLLDCGNGVLSRLQQFISPNKLSAIIVSHLHSDHISDLFILRYALQLELEQGVRDSPLQLISPDQPSDEYFRLPYKNVYQLETITEKERFTIGPFQFSFLKTIHPVCCYAIAVFVEGIKILVYSSDTEYFPELADFARGVPMFLCEANFLTEDLQKGARNHLSAFQAACLARDAGAEKLLLTHLPPFRNPQSYLDEALIAFKQVKTAEEGKVYFIESSDE